MTRAERRRAEREHEKLLKRARAWKERMDAGYRYQCPTCDRWFKTLERLFEHQDLKSHLVMRGCYEVRGLDEGDVPEGWSAYPID